MIAFYVPSDEYGFLCNFAGPGFVLDGQYWLTAEHYFQAQKFEDAGYREQIRSVRSPKTAKVLGQSRKHRIRHDRNTVRIDVMRRCLEAKFTADGDIRRRLLETDSHELIENAPGDYFWGCGADGSGRNMLGRLLMELRDQLGASAEKQDDREERV